MKKTSSSAKAPTLCECGCEKETRGGRFLPGHDAKLKYSLIESAIKGGKRAEAKLEKLGWTKHLEAKRAKLAVSQRAKPVAAAKTAPAPKAAKAGRKNSPTSAAPAQPEPVEQVSQPVA